MRPARPGAKTGPAVRTIAIINQKGGCGKTTTAINLAAVFARRGFRTLLIDMDPQSHCAAGLGIPEKCIERDVTDALLTPESRPIDADRLIWRVARNLDLVPSRMRLAGLEAARGGLADAPDKEGRLRRALQRLDATTPPDGESLPNQRHRYDVCLIDCPPSIGLLTYNALVASREILIPVETSFFSLKGAGKQVNTVRSLARRLGLRIRPHLVATMHDASVPIAKDLLRELREQFGPAVVPTVVRADPSVKEAASLGRPVIDHAPSSPGAEDYTSLCEWLVEHAEIEREELDDAGSLEPTMAVEVAAPEPHDRSPTTPGAPISRLEELARRARAMSSRPFSPVIPVATAPATAIPQRSAPLPAAVLPAWTSPAPTAPATTIVATAAAIRRSMLAKPVAVELVSEPEIEPRAMPESIRELLGCRPTARGALFVQPLSIGRRVCIAGDFNAWRPETAVMRRNEALGVFELQLDLPPGAHRYRLVVDGRWCTDEHNPDRDRNDFGDENNVVRVPGHRA